MEDFSRDSTYWRTNQTRETVENWPAAPDRDYQNDYPTVADLEHQGFYESPDPDDDWSVTPGESGLAWYWENTINGHRVTIIERPAIGYCCWMAATMTDASDVQTAATLDDAKQAAEDWAKSH